MQQQIQEHFKTTDFVATLGVGLFNFVRLVVVLEASLFDMSPVRVLFLGL